MDTLIEREAAYPEDVHPKLIDACILRTETLCGMAWPCMICRLRQVVALADVSRHVANLKRERFAEHLQVSFDVARWNYFQPNVTHLK